MLNNPQQVRLEIILALIPSMPPALVRKGNGNLLIESAENIACYILGNENDVAQTENSTKEPVEVITKEAPQGQAKNKPTPKAK